MGTYLLLLVHVLLLLSALCAKAHNHVHQEKELNHFSHSVLPLLLQRLAPKKVFNILRPFTHELNPPVDKQFNFLNQNPMYTKENKFNNKKRLRNRAVKYEGETLFVYLGGLGQKMMGVRMKHHRPVHGDEAHRHFSAGISQPRQRWKRTVGLSSSSV